MCLFTYLVILICLSDFQTCGKLTHMCAFVSKFFFVRFFSLAFSSFCLLSCVLLYFVSWNDVCEMEHVNSSSRQRKETKWPGGCGAKQQLCNAFDTPPQSCFTPTLRHVWLLLVATRDLQGVANWCNFELLFITIVSVLIKYVYICWKAIALFGCIIYAFMPINSHLFQKFETAVLPHLNLLFHTYHSIFVYTFFDLSL